MIDWQLLGEYFLPHVDIEAELAGGNYRRDAEQVACGDVSYYDDRRDEALRLLAQLSVVSEDRGSLGMEKSLSTSSSSETASEASASVSEYSPCYSTPEVLRVSDDECDRRCTTRSTRVHKLWVDSAASCIYGGLCPQFYEPSHEHSACQHSPVFEGGSFQNDNSPDARRLSTSDPTRNTISYASRARWQRQTNSRKRKCNTKKARACKKIQKTSIHINRFTWRSRHPTNRRPSHINNAQNVQEA